VVITWLAAFADVPEPLVDTALRFWTAVTASTVGEAAGDRDEYLPVAGPDEDPYLWVQRVQRPESDGGWHLDLMVDDLPAAVRQATGLGAELVRQVPGLIGLSTPAGQSFCLLAAERERRRARPRRWPTGQHSLLDQLCLDIPARAFDAECRFWSELTGWPQRSSSPEFVNLTRPATVPLRLLLRRLGEDDGGPARAHADLACDNVPAERDRHQTLGAELVRIAEHWTTLRDPAGLLYCITDRDPYLD
jgi:predicted enzyme related to lactoylglutathione lyase